MITDIHHVGIAVRDLRAALAFYAEALELPLVKEAEAPSRGAKVAIVGVGDAYLELVQPTSEDTPFGRHIAESGEGLHHIALRTDDVDSLVASLRAKGAPLADETPREGVTGRLSYLKPEAFDGAIIEVVEPSAELSGGHKPAGALTRIDHAVLRVPFAQRACERMRDWFGVETKRTFERGDLRFSFAKPGDVILEIIGPREEPAQPRPGFVGGLALECEGIERLAARLKGLGLPVGEPHPALQGGHIVSVHQSGAFGVPLAFMDFTGSETKNFTTPRRA